jgi:effector-binding domain-containing protein
MSHVTIQQVPAHSIAIIRDRAKIPELSVKVPALCGRAWNFIKKNGLKSSGRMIAVYHFDVHKDPKPADFDMDIEVGAEVDAPFTGSDGVESSQTPAGTVAMTVHVGPYNKLGQAHDAIRAFCKQNGKQIAGTCWELYGHWTDVESKLTTDVFHLLR